MTKLNPRVSFSEAVDMLISAKVITDREMSVGTNSTHTTIELPAGGIDADADKLFKRVDVCRLIGYAKFVVNPEQ